MERLEATWLEQFTEFSSNLHWFLENRLDLVALCVNRTNSNGVDTLALTIVDQGQLKRMLERICDSEEFLSPYGLRSLSKSHAEHPFVLGHSRVTYEPGEAVSKIKGGNSNWRDYLGFHEYFHGDTGAGLSASHQTGWTGLVASLIDEWRA